LGQWDLVDKEQSLADICNLQEGILFFLDLNLWCGGYECLGSNDFKAGKRILARGRPAVIESSIPRLDGEVRSECMNALDVTKVPYNALSQKLVSRWPKSR
jgi:hypothetical protein